VDFSAQPLPNFILFGPYFPHIKEGLEYMGLEIGSDAENQD